MDKRPFDIVISCPASLAPVANDLVVYFSDMVAKLEKNSHRGRWPGAGLRETFDWLRKEVEELRQAIIREGDDAVRLEAADVGVMAMIVSCVAIEARKGAAPRGVDLLDTFE